MTDGDVSCLERRSVDGARKRMDEWIGADLVEWREGLELTQEQAADILGITSRTIWNWENREEPIKTCVMLACRYITEHPYIVPYLQRKVPLTPKPGRRLPP